jgi:hypothetical protein
MSQAQTVVYASAARTATPTAYISSTRSYTALRIVLDATAVTSTPSVVVTVDVLDVASGKYVNLVTSAAIATVSTNVLTIATGLSGTVRITATHGNANSITYTLGAHWSR